MAKKIARGYFLLFCLIDGRSPGPVGNAVPGVPYSGNFFFFVCRFATRPSFFAVRAGSLAGTSLRAYRFSAVSRNDSGKPLWS